MSAAVVACNSETSCLLALGKAAYQRSMITEFADALASTGTRCHEAAHGISAWVVKDSSRPEEWLRQAALLEPCLGGFVHGVFDSYFPLAYQDTAKVAALLAVCAELTEQGSASCADGAGHGIYQASHDLDASLQVCGMLSTEALQAACTGGVAMQMFRPENDGSRPPDYPLSEVTTSGVAFCEKAAAVLAPYAGEGCVLGLSLPYTVELDGQTQEELARPRPDLETLRGKWLEKVAGCDKFSDWVDACRWVIGLRLGMATMDHVQARTVLCGHALLRQCRNVTSTGEVTSAP